MKHLILFLSFCLGSTVFSQVTRNEIEVMMTELGTSLDKIEELFVGNTMDYFKDGTSKESYDKYSSDRGNTFKLTDNGIKAIYKPEGKIQSVFFVPYDKIVTIDIGLNYITLYLIH